jgi:hypothetical protein
MVVRQEHERGKVKGNWQRDRDKPALLLLRCSTSPIINDHRRPSQIGDDP